MSNFVMWLIVFGIAALIIVVFIYDQKNRRELDEREATYNAERDAIMEPVGIAAVTEALHPPRKRRAKVIRPIKKSSKPAKKAAKKK